MRKFYVITNRSKDQNLTLTHEISGYLEAHGCVCYVREDVQGEACDIFGDMQGKTQEIPGNIQADACKIPEDVECVLVLGGDGTLLRAAREVVELGIPLLGVNLGTLGYLAELEQKNIYPALDCLIRDEYQMERRMMLSGKVYHEGQLIAEDLALNDIGITREGALRVIQYHNYVNDGFLNSYKADGIIISTPTGSTGYSLSAGGPIISPAASLILMTPLAPHTLNSRSIIFPEEDKITVEIGDGRDGKTEHAVATFDGATSVSMVSGDKIEITKAKKDTLILKISNTSFLETLRTKMSHT